MIMSKKLIAIFSVFILLIMCVSVVFATGDELEILPGIKYDMGDANTDGEVNVKDATAIQKHIAGIAPLNSLQINLSDVNSDDAVNIKDATYIQKVVADLIKPQPTETEGVSYETVSEETSVLDSSVAPFETIIVSTYETTVAPTSLTESVTASESVTDTVTFPAETETVPVESYPSVPSETTTDASGSEPSVPTEKPTRDPNKPIELPFIPAL